jgi:hypothetical protein
MLRARLAAYLIFNLLLAAWVLHDARTRRAPKPLFAALITLLWGPFGLGFWASDRPLAGSERRASVGATLATTVVLAWTALVPTIFVLALPDIRERSAVPGSLGRTLGVPLASALVALAIWIGPTLIALILGRASSRTTVPESGTPDVAAARPSLPWAIVFAAVAALLVAIAATA